jgi:hypothetical protein
VLEEGLDHRVDKGSFLSTPNEVKVNVPLDSPNATLYELVFNSHAYNTGQVGGKASTHWLR